MPAEMISMTLTLICVMAQIEVLREITISVGPFDEQPSRIASIDLSRSWGKIDARAFLTVCTPRN